MQRIYLFIVMLTFAIVLPAQKQKADSLYISQHYQEAAALYEAMLAEGTDADLHYNLANAYFRMNEYPRAVLHYERALKVAPNHADARYNLGLCLAKLGVAEGYADELFFSTISRNVLLSLSANEWMMCCYVAMAILLVCIAAFCLVGSVRMKKLCFLASLLAVVFVIVVNAFAYNAKEAYLATERIVVMQPVVVYEGPTQQAKSFGQLTPGATYTIDIQHGDEWIRLVLSDGSVGWCERSAVEFI